MIFFFFWRGVQLRITKKQHPLHMFLGGKNFDCCRASPRPSPSVPFLPSGRKSHWVAPISVTQAITVLHGHWAVLYGQKSAPQLDLPVSGIQKFKLAPPCTYTAFKLRIHFYAWETRSKLKTHQRYICTARFLWAYFKLDKKT
jgi:hypothetical protein